MNDRKYTFETMNAQAEILFDENKDVKRKINSFIGQVALDMSPASKLDINLSFTERERILAERRTDGTELSPEQMIYILQNIEGILSFIDQLKQIDIQYLKDIEKYEPLFIKMRNRIEEKGLKIKKPSLWAKIFGK